MKLPTEKLELAIFLYQKMEGRVVDGRSVSGHVPETFDFSEVKRLVEKEELLVAEDANTRNIEISLPGIFYSDLNEVLRSAARRTSPQGRFYVADMDYLYEAGCADIPVGIRQYFEFAKLFQMLKGVADYVDEFGAYKSLVFLQKSKMEIVPDYQVGDLREIDGLSEFDADFVQSEMHKDQKATIIKTVLFEMFGASNRVELSEIISRFGELARGVKSSYELYVSEFSFQKIKAEVEKDKLEFTAKLNKVFSDIQNQLLAVPAAVILVGGQMNYVGHWGLKNCLIWLGSLIYSVLMSLLISNQRSTLDVVKSEVDEQWGLIRGQHQSVAERFSKSYIHLEKRYEHQCRLLLIVDGLVSISLMFSTWMLLHYSVSELLSRISSEAGLLAGAVTALCYLIVRKWREKSIQRG
jgi:hypothetical protein